jgi:16S rRNA G527 N7-methylase RsmG
MVGIVNWNEFRKTMLLSTRRIQVFNNTYWEKTADNFNRNTANLNDLTQTQLSKLHLNSNDSVIDIGAGTGRLTIPIAKQVKQVTAAEPSQNMAAFLKQKAQQENLTNITHLDVSCQDLKLDQNVSVHDVVISSYALFMLDIEQELLKIDSLAKKTVYLFYSASKWMDDEIQRIIFGDVVPLALPHYIYLYNILFDLGILSNVEITEYTHQENYSNLDEALKKYRENYNVNKDKENQIVNYLNTILVREADDQLWLRRKRKMAVIWWTKNP